MKMRDKYIAIEIELEDDQKFVYKASARRNILVDRADVWVGGKQGEAVVLEGVPCTEDGKTTTGSREEAIVPASRLCSTEVEDLITFAKLKAGMADTWDCIHPCALLALSYQQAIMSGEAKKQEIERTLNCWGWADEHGKPDVAKAKSEWSRFFDIRTAPPEPR
jgi:hypothetical protein